MRRLVAVLLVLLLAAPLAGARLVAEGESPWESGHPSNPQLYCVVVFEDPGSHACHVRGDVKGVDVVRIRIAGLGAKVHVGVVDNLGPSGWPEQRAIVDCSSSCLAAIPGGPHTDADWTMHVYADAPAGKVYVQASLEARTRVHDRDV